MTDKSDLDRFLGPQDQTHAQALGELRSGRKLTHWIWWEMPQLRSLGRSQRARDYGLADLDEAQRYLAHPVLGPRLVALCEALLLHSREPPESILGPVDALKVRSMATLFAAVPEAPAVFKALLDIFYEGQPCPLTVAEIRL
ncbi:DUF1810 family protein [Shimia sp. SDUM112013]|uniref:DUF1810 domain-containing protein n=1 Tax=Shimia sp. SDUM112013 TaxID=3136160 RepID=UPI0032EB00FF